MALPGDRACTGASVKTVNSIDILDGLPAPIAGAAPAYPDGWITVSIETDAAMGFRLTDALTHDLEMADPIPHCLRLMWSDWRVRAWTQTYSMIANGFKAPPEWTPPAYSAIMIGIRGVLDGIAYARAQAANRRPING